MRKQDQVAQRGIGDFGVAERLVGIVDRLAVDAQSRFRVVLDLDRQVAAHRFHEQGVEHVDVRVLAHHVLVARGGGPLEIMRRRQGDIALAAVVDVGGRALLVQLPAEHAQVALALADLEGGQQLALVEAQLHQLRIAVVVIQFLEFGHEARVGQEAAVQRQRVELHFGAVLAQAVQREDVRHPGFLAQADEDVIAEQQYVADQYQVARAAVVVGAGAGAGAQRHLFAAEFGQPGFVQRGGFLQQGLALAGQPLAQQVEAAGVAQGRLGTGRCCLFLAHGLVLQSLLVFRCAQEGQHLAAVRLAVQPGADAGQFGQVVAEARLHGLLDALARCGLCTLACQRSEAISSSWPWTPSDTRVSHSPASSQIAWAAAL